MEDTPRILEWKRLRGPQVQAMDRSRTVVLVTCSPIEVHGPHLPLMADMFEGETLLERAVRRFDQAVPGLTYLKLPTLYTAADVLPQAGSLHFRVSTVVEVLKDLGRSVARQGFKHLWVGNFHGGPRHILALEQGSSWVHRRYGINMVSVFSLLYRRLTGGKNDLTDVLEHLEGVERAYLEGDEHAGFVETSMLMHLIPELVDDEYEALPQVTVNRWLEEQGAPPVEKERPGPGGLLRLLRENLRFYESQTYAGHPGAGSAAAGARILETLAGLTAEALEDLWHGRIPPAEWHTPLWPLRWIINSSLLDRLFKWWWRHRSEVW